MAWRMQHKTFAGFTIEPRLTQTVACRHHRQGRLPHQVDHRRDRRRHPDDRQVPSSPRCRRRDRFTAMQEVAGTGPLAAVMQDAKADTGRSMDDLTVMGEDSDPYRLDTPANHLVGQWFAAQVERFIAPDKNIHSRGVYYACVSAGGVKKPDGDPFNGHRRQCWLDQRWASRLARWLGYVPFERIIDNKNDKPIVRLAPTRDDPSAHSGATVSRSRVSILTSWRLGWPRAFRASPTSIRLLLAFGHLELVGVRHTRNALRRRRRPRVGRGTH